ncbi:MAG: hypothetical protein H0Z32_10430 [Bacillaceae bacterium]|nr:hypothetical protein [Bacillaceae bacterium]
MGFSKLLEADPVQTDPEERQKELEELEFQVYRMRENMKKISRRYDIIGIDHTKHSNWVIVYKEDDGNICRVMLDDCQSPFRGSWDFCIQAEYTDNNKIHIADIKGPEDQGYGSILMNYLKDIAIQQNIQAIKGDIVKRDWDHVDRLEHFYAKHNFTVNLDYENKSGSIEWNQMNR